MFKKIFLSLLVLHTCNLVYSDRKCNDCQLYYTCKAAVDHARFKQDDETRQLFEKAVCGTEMEDDESEYMIATLVDTGEGPQFKCGGTIINSKYILTAAHCVVDKKIEGVRIGEFDINLDRDCEYEPDKVICEDHIQDMYVKEKIPHENYQRSPTLNDIALLRVDGEIFLNYTNVEPICLPLSSSLRSKSLDNKNGTVAGWGYTETGRESAILLRVEVPVKTEAECKAYYNRNNRDAVKKQFCAGELKKDSCNGDSGGPLMMKANYNGVNSYVQYGIVSHGPMQCGSSFPGVYTDVREYVDWILDNIKG
ncbi:unnamed protein product [Pieris brassicae]|uniref:Peptidase S1 domain-containing protein n=1 Tax=Pieris brassicae TaxID=7116 RepID=A0A9P0TN12_PIEBR|nr:unnamed protein product [Pieris brassicae]